MKDDKSSFRFSELSQLYCENIDIIDTAKKQWKTDTGELARRVSSGLAQHNDEWDFYFADSYGTIRKKSWGSDPRLEYELGFEPSRIAKGKLALKIHVRVADRELWGKICRELEKQIEGEFGGLPNPRSPYIAYTERKVADGDYEAAIVKAVEDSIRFASNLDPYTEAT